MNERLQNLAREAGHFEFNKWDYFDIEKFAELIIKECCGIIEVDLDTNKIKAETDNEGRIWVNAQLTFSELIKSRFGIKE